MAAAMSARIGYNTVRKLVQFSFSHHNYVKGISHFHKSAFLSVIGQEIKMPSLSPTMSEGTIVKWYKKEGDPIAPGDVLCDIQTDKAVVSFEIEEEGILAKILMHENTPDIKVGTLIALMVNTGEDWKSVEVSASSSPAESKSVEASAKTDSGSKPVSASQPDSGSGRKVIPGASFLTSTLTSYGPAVKYLLERYDLKANAVTPTGHRSKLLKEDVLKYIQEHKVAEKPLKSVAPPQKGAPAVAALSKAAPQKAAKGVAKPRPSGYIDIQISSMRKTIAKRLTESKSTIPHSYASIVSNISGLLVLRKQMKAEGIGVSVNDFVIKAAGLALQQFPEVNSHWKQDQLVQIPGIDISVAVATDAGLITPIVENVPAKGLLEISSSVKDLAKRGREGKLKPNEFQGGSFTISNLGMFGVKQFSAIINPPQCAILAVGAGQILLGEDRKPRTNMYATLSYDRRAFDEGIAAEFLQAFQTMLQEPSMMIAGGSPDSRGTVKKITCL